MHSEFGLKISELGFTCGIDEGVLDFRNTGIIAIEVGLPFFSRFFFEFSSQ